MCKERNVLIVTGVIIAIIIAYVMFRKKPENFNNMRYEHMTNPIYAETNYQEPPKVNVETGTLVDGPGFETGEVDNVDQAVLSKIPSDYYFLDDGADGKFSITSNLFSKSCCSAQWPVPFHQKYDPYVCNNKDQYVGSNIFGSNTFQDSGCACLTKDQAKFMYSRGGNGMEWF